MAELKEITAFLESLVPLREQDSWDNSGLQVGWEKQEITKVCFALSLSEETLKEAISKGCHLLITHHPLTITGVKQFVEWKYPSNLLLKLLKENIALYSLHTNLDVSPLGPTAIIAEALKLESEGPIVETPPYGIVGRIKEQTQKELLRNLLSVVEKDIYRTVNFKPEKVISKVAICSGSGAGFIETVAGKVDVYITGDVKYHDALKAMDLGLTVFDLGHHGTERLFYRKLLPLLKEHFPEVTFEVLRENSPFEVVNHVE